MDKELNLVEIFRLLLKKIKIIFTITLTFVVFTLFYSLFLVTPKYSSTAQIIVSPTSLGGQQISLNQLQINTKLIDTYESILFSDEVLELVNSELSFNYSPNQIKERIKITTNRDTQSFGIEATDANAEYATEIANSAAKILKENLASYFKTNSEINILSSAKVPNSPSSPKILLNTISAAFFGILFGAFIIILIELFNPRINNIKLMKGYNWLNFGKIKEFSDIVEEDTIIDSIRSKIEIVLNKSKIKSVLITTPNKTIKMEDYVYKLSHSFSNIGLNVLVIDCDINNPTLHRKFSIENDYTFLDQVEKIDFSRIDKVEKTNINFITGSQIQNSAKNFSVTKIQRLISILESKFDLIILSAQPLDENSDTLVIANSVNNIVLYIRNNFSKIQNIQEIEKLTKDFDINVLGYIYENN